MSVLLNTGGVFISGIPRFSASPSVERDEQAEFLSEVPCVMKKFPQAPLGLSFADGKWLLPLLASLLLSLALVVVASIGFRVSQGTPFYQFAHVDGMRKGGFHRPDSPSPPRFAYFISGTKGDSERIIRLLQTVYHPRNQYILHLDLEASPKERIELARFVRLHRTCVEYDNVVVIGKANSVSYRGPSMTATTLHAAAILLRRGQDWDWFINLSAADYPLVTQDDLLHVFSYLPKDLNFIEHTSNVGWKEYQRARPIVVDPGLYMANKADIFWVTQRRTMPSSFKLFIGSAWVVLTRNFLEYCILGWDNLPRTMLMYFSNFVSSSEGYFHSVICNAREFRNTTINHDLHYVAWGDPPKPYPSVLGIKNFDAMNRSGAAFAREFLKNDPVLDRIDRELLGRSDGYFTPGGWCVGPWRSPCKEGGDPAVLRPGPGAKRLELLLLDLLAPHTFRARQCI